MCKILHYAPFCDKISILQKTTEENELLYWLIPLIVVASLVFLVLLTAFICFLKVFYSPRWKKAEEYPTPKGEIYDPYRDQMIQWIKEVRAMPHQNAEVTSFDGLTLRGNYYEKEKGLPIEILFHGYRGSSEQDLSGAVYRCFRLNRNALIVDHRGSGRSDGHIITFGVNESRDCLRWIDYVINNIDKDAKILITGISMGASTVMTAAGMELPHNVVGVLADCGYSSAEEIIKKVMVDMKLPPKLMYPLVRLGGILFGRFDPNELSPIKSMKKCRLPIIFFHGADDAYVPCDMSKQLYQLCASEHKRVVITDGAGHGLCFSKDMDTYFREVENFFAPFV